MLCPQCRAENTSPRRRFCAGCGASLTHGVVPAASQTSRTLSSAADVVNPLHCQLRDSPRLTAASTHPSRRNSSPKRSSRAARRLSRVNANRSPCCFADLRGSMELARRPRSGGGAAAPRSGPRAHDGGGPSLRGHRQPGHGRRHHGALRRADRPRGSRGAGVLCGALNPGVDRGARRAAPAVSVLPRVRIGLNAGEVVVRESATTLTMDYTAVGQTTHLAARMEQARRVPARSYVTDAFARSDARLSALQAPGPRRNHRSPRAGRGVFELRGRRAYLAAGSRPRRAA